MMMICNIWQLRFTILSQWWLSLRLSQSDVPQNVMYPEVTLGLEFDPQHNKVLGQGARSLHVSECPEI